MASPAKQARFEASAKGFTEVIKRGNNFIVCKNPNNNKCSITAQAGGGWHYNGDLETDTAWESGVAPWDYQMVKANYNLFALSNFTNGQIIKWTDPETGKYVTFQPMSLKWTNSINQIQQISFAQNVQAMVEGDIITWPGAYGVGRDFSYVAGTTRMQKLLKIADPLPATSYDILELEFIMDPSKGVDIHINGEIWDKKTRSDTTQEVYFKSGENVLWYFTIPLAFDSAGNETTGILRLRKSGNSLYCSVRFPKSWIDAATFPVFIDPTIDVQIGASADDGYFVSGTGTAFNNSASLLYSGSNPAMYFFACFPEITIPDDSTIDVAYLSVYGNTCNGAVYCDIFAEDASDPSAISSAADGRSRVKTSASVAFDTYSSGWQNTDSIIAIIEELLASYSYAGGAAIQIICTSENSSHYITWKSCNATGNVSGPKLYIEYSTGGAESSISAITNHYRQQGAM